MFATISPLGRWSGIALIAGTAILAGCSQSPPPYSRTTTTTEQVTTTPAPLPPMVPLGSTTTIETQQTHGP
jgi:PBP1b-binding outer membrane lipoprotein LpoB